MAIKKKTNQVVIITKITFVKVDIFNILFVSNVRILHLDEFVSIVFF